MSSQLHDLHPSGGATGTVAGIAVTKQRRRLAAIALAPLVALLLAGCVLIEVDLELTRNDEVTGSIAIGVSQNFYDEASLPPEARISDAFGGIEGAEVTVFQEDGFIGERAIFSGVPMIVFVPRGDGGQVVTLERDGDLIRIGGVIDLSDLEGAENFGASADDVSVRIKVPGDIIASNGTVDEATNTITWNPRFGEELQLSATIDSPVGGGFGLGTAVGIAAAIVLGAVAVIFLRSRKKVAEASEESGDVASDKASPEN